MEPNTQQVPGYFVWDVPGQPVVVYVSLAVVDRLSADIMRGFGAVPKRGAEVGGTLLGTVGKGDRPIVYVEDFEPIATSYGRGPSYLLSPAERTQFGAAIVTRQSSPLPPIGYYRSHTRDGPMSLGPEDLELIASYFPDHPAIALLVKPFGTKVSVAGFFAKNDGVFPEETPLEFPFRRREILGEDAPPRRSLEQRALEQRALEQRTTEERAPRPRRGRDEGTALENGPLAELPSGAEAPSSTAISAPPPAYGSPATYTGPAAYGEQPLPRRRTWAWLPLCFLFLVLGVALGYQVAVTFAPELRHDDGAKAFALNLTAGRNGNSVTVRWDRDSPAVHAAENGVLEIEDGGVSKPVQLDAAHLRDGTVVYQNSSQMVKFRLVIHITSRVSVSETVDWRP